MEFFHNAKQAYLFIRYFRENTPVKLLRNSKLLLSRKKRLYKQFCETILKNLHQRRLKKDFCGSKSIWSLCAFKGGQWIKLFYFHRIANPNIILFSMHELFYLIVQMLLSGVMLCTKKGQCLHEYNFSVSFLIFSGFLEKLKP